MSAKTLAISPHYEINDEQVLTVGTSQVAFPSISSTAGFTGTPENVFIQAYSQNTGRIVIGKTGVSASAGTGGYELAAGANMNLPFKVFSSYFAIATAAGQKLFITYQSKPI